MKILVVEDDPETMAYLMRGLSQESHAVDQATTAEDGLELSRRYPFDIVIVDRMLPGMDGLAFVKQLRTQHNTARVLFLTAMDGLDDRIEGLDAGGDDYLPKPFAFSELRARIAALGRRELTAADANRLVVGDLVLDLLSRTVKRQDAVIVLLAKEYQLLDYLMRNHGRIVTRTMLLERVWNLDFDPGSNVVETHVSRLRAKIDKPFDKPMLKTIRGLGYRLDAC
jgi:two-component system, OmpR family, response regulator